MALPIAFVLVVVAYFAAVAALLRVFSSWDTNALLRRAAVLAIACNAPLLLGGGFGMVLYVLMASAAIRVLVSAYDVGLVGAFVSIAAGSVVSFTVPLAFI